jgi:hypothetical protein
MIAYSQEAKPLAEKAISKLVGCTALLISDDTYYTKKKCNKEYLSKIHERGWPYVLAPEIFRNEICVEGALNPRYAVLESNGQLVVLGKDILPINSFQSVDEVFYSDTKWNIKEQPASNQQKFNCYDEWTKELLTMGTNNFSIMYARWNNAIKRWEYPESHIERADYRHPQMFITREGFLNWRIKPDLYSMHLNIGKTDKADLKIICAWCLDEINQTKKLVHTNGVANRYEYEEYRMQICALWLLMETCKNLSKANKKIDSENLSAIIDSIQAKNIGNDMNSTLAQYMYIYSNDVVDLAQ